MPFLGTACSPYFTISLSSENASPPRAFCPWSLLPRHTVPYRDGAQNWAQRFPHLDSARLPYGRGHQPPHRGCLSESGQRSKTLCEVPTVSREQEDATAPLHRDSAVAVQFQFVLPFRPVRQIGHGEAQHRHNEVTARMLRSN